MESETKKAARHVAKIAADLGGRALLVGGCVRDVFLGVESKDCDIEVFGVEGAALRAALEREFHLDEVGASFGVIKLHDYDIDVALPRRETKLGLGHKAFDVECDPSLSVKEAASRRDFTINAIYQDPLTDEIIDPWNGQKDLKRGILRHVSEHFCEDPLRVLRGMQFIARFDLTAASETLEICRSMTLEALAPERQFEEWKKLLLRGKKISKGLEFLRNTDWVKLYPELAALIGCEQAKEWHPEGDVWNHTLCALDAFAKGRDAISQDDDENIIVALAILCHDFGKPATSFYDKRKCRIRSLGHDEKGVELALSFLRRLTNEERILKEVPPLVRLHLRPYSMWRSQSGESAIRRLASEVKRIDRLVRVCKADEEGRPPMKPDFAPLEWLEAEAQRLRVKDSAPKPLLQGRDLIALGLKPAKEFGQILKRAYSAQLDGVFQDREAALKWLEEKKNHTPLYIIWDWNGTLLDDTRAAFDTLNIMLEKRHAPKIEFGFYRDNFAFPVKPFYKAIGVVLENEDWDALAQEYHDIYHEQVKALNPQALEAIKIIDEFGVDQCILSALRQDLLERDTAFYGVRDKMELLAGVNNLDGASKVDIAKRLLYKLKATHPQVGRFVMIGDALHDKEVADALGIECVLCSQGSHAHWRLEKVAPTFDTLIAAVNFALAPATAV